jgi:hypothetical protein
MKKEKRPKYTIYEFQIINFYGEWETVATISSEGLYNLLLPTLAGVYVANQTRTIIQK